MTFDLLASPLLQSCQQGIERRRRSVFRGGTVQARQTGRTGRSRAATEVAARVLYFGFVRTRASLTRLGRLISPAYEPRKSNRNHEGNFDRSEKSHCGNFHIEGEGAAGVFEIESEAA